MTTVGIFTPQLAISNLKHSFHPELDDDAKALGDKDLDQSEKHLVSSKVTIS
jgi:hypothetical protein